MRTRESLHLSYHRTWMLEPECEPHRSQFDSHSETSTSESQFLSFQCQDVYDGDEHEHASWLWRWSTHKVHHGRWCSMVEVESVHYEQQTTIAEFELLTHRASIYLVSATLVLVESWMSHSMRNSDQLPMRMTCSKHCSQKAKTLEDQRMDKNKKLDSQLMVRL